MEKETIKQIKAYVLILNLLISVIAFSSLISAGFTGGAEGVTGGGNVGTPPTTTTTGTTGGTGTTTDIPPPTTDTTIGDTPPGGGIDFGNGTTPPPGGDVPPGGNGGPGGGIDNIIDGIRKIKLQSIIYKGSIGAGIFSTIGVLAGGDDGAMWGAIAGAIGGAVAGLTEPWLGELWSTVLGIGIATLIFVLTYKKASEEITEFYCLPWQAPIGGEDCELCNEFEECSDYTCRSLGQACAIINEGSEEQKCIWQNPHDVNSPTIEMIEVSKDHIFKPDKSVRPPATGVVITPTDRKCIKAFTPLEFEFITNEPAQCKIDYNLTTGFEEMSFYVGGDVLFIYNHSEKLSLPGPSAFNAVNPTLKNNGEYSLFIRCTDANGNFNQDAYSVSFCVEKGPDTTPPLIVDTNVEGGSPVQFNQTSLDLEVYVNEPSECKWSREDRSYGNMEGEMDCDLNLWEMNSQQVYTCRTTLTGIMDRKENNYYFKCKDQPWASEGDRNTNVQSYPFVVIGTQPLNILSSAPSGTISGSTDTIPIFLVIITDNGYRNGESLCYYYNDRDNAEPVNEEDYVLFLETGKNEHNQRQDLVEGKYTYYFKCVDLGGNAVYNYTTFTVKTDRQAPIVVRVYREGGELKIMTNEDAECSYSNDNCNFEIESGIEMTSINDEEHTSEWRINTNYYIRCKDKYENQPNPNVCSIIVRPVYLEDVDVSGGWSFGW